MPRLPLDPLIVRNGTPPFSAPVFSHSRLTFVLKQPLVICSTGAVRQRIELVDTAGLLKSQRAPPSFATDHAHVDVQSFLRTRQTVKRAQVVVLVVDTTVRHWCRLRRYRHLFPALPYLPPHTRLRFRYRLQVPHADNRDELVRSLVHGKDPLLRKEDAAIVRLVAEEGRALVVALNKWDTLGADGQSKALLSSLDVEPWDPGDVSPRAPRFAAPSTAKGLFQIILKQINDIMPPQVWVVCCRCGMWWLWCPISSPFLFFSLFLLSLFLRSPFPSFPFAFFPLFLVSLFVVYPHLLAAVNTRTAALGSCTWNVSMVLSARR